MKKFNNLSRNIFIALFLGIAVGLIIPGAAPYVSFLGLIFKLSLAMIVMPIVLTSILCGLESVGNISKLSGLGIRTVFYYLATTFIAIIVGLTLVTIISPGLQRPSVETSQAIKISTGNSASELSQNITQNIAKILKFDLDSTKARDLQQSLMSLAQENFDADLMKHQAQRFVGSLEIRSRLEHDQRPGQVQAMPVRQFLEAQIKKALINPFEALAEKHVLAVIIFTLLLGGAMTTIGPLSKTFFDFNRAVNLSVIKIVDLIMHFAPFGVFGLIVEVVAVTGLEVFSQLGLYALCVALGLSCHLFIILPLINYFFGNMTPREFFRGMKPALAVAFSTSSSSATLPITMQAVEKNLKVDKRVVDFVLPLGATINMDGTALYEAVAAVFIAQLYGVSLGLSSQIIIAITAALAAIGAAGIPAAGTVTMALVLSAVGLPIEAVGILLAIDRPLDMCRTAVNIAGDATGCVVLNKIGKKYLT